MKGRCCIIIPLISCILFILCSIMGCSAPLAQEQNTSQSGAGNGTLFGQLTPMIVRTPVPTVLVQSQSTTKIEPVLVTTERTVSGSGSVLLDDTCSLAIREYKEYSLEDTVVSRN